MRAARSNLLHDEVVDLDSELSGQAISFDVSVLLRSLVSSSKQKRVYQPCKHFPRWAAIYEIPVHEKTASSKARRQRNQLNSDLPFVLSFFQYEVRIRSRYKIELARCGYHLFDNGIPNMNLEVFTHPFGWLPF